jgi:ABC-type branched-subunit amino acid transport system substrate-binding protein
MKRTYGWLLILILLVLLSACGGGRAGRQGSMPTAPQLTDAVPREAESLWIQAEKAEKSGNMQNAISLWERIIRNYSGTTVSARAYYKIGNAYLEKGQAERALQHFDYLVFSYPQWDGVGLAKLGQLRSWWLLGKKKDVLEGALPLWEASGSQPEVQVGLSRLMIQAYQAEGDLQTAFDWLSAGFAAAKLPEDKKLLTQSGVELLRAANEQAVKKIFSKNPSEFMKVFLELRIAQLEMQTPARQEAARQRLRALLSQNANHPLIPEIQMAIRSVPGSREIPLNADRIGVMVPLNGPNAEYGNMILKGLDAAKASWIEKHPNDGITLVVKDAHAGADAKKAFEEMTEKEGVLAIIGPLGPQAVKAVTPLANGASVPLLALAQKDEENVDNSFVINPFIDSRDMVRALVRHCREKLGYTKFATLYPEDRYGQNLSKLFAEAVQESGGSLLASVPYKEKSTDFREPITKLLNIARKNAPASGEQTAPFEALFLPDQVQSVSVIAPQLPHYNVVGVTLLGPNLWSEGPLAQAGGVYVEQAIFATPS